MRKLFTTLAFAAVLLCNAADIKTLHVTTEPQMVCNNCENKIKKTLRFEKGIKQIDTDLEHQIVTVVYDAEKTDEQKIVDAFGKMKYKATVIEEEAKVACPVDSKAACCGKSNCQDKPAGSCPEESEAACCGKSAAAE